MSSLFEWNNEAHKALLERIRAHLPQLEALQQEMIEAEPVGILHFYRSDPRVFELQPLSVRAMSLFRNIAANGELALSFEVIMQDTISSRLDLTSSRMWILGATPAINGFYHCKLFVEQHVRYGRELVEQPPGILPLCWAAVLSLYGQGE
jgi:hypothetical protein